MRFAPHGGPLPVLKKRHEADVVGRQGQRCAGPQERVIAVWHDPLLMWLLPELMTPSCNSTREHAVSKSGGRWIRTTARMSAPQSLDKPSQIKMGELIQNMMINY